MNRPALEALLIGVHVAGPSRFSYAIRMRTRHGHRRTCIATAAIKHMCACGNILLMGTRKSRAALYWLQYVFRSTEFIGSNATLTWRSADHQSRLWPPDWPRSHFGAGAFLLYIAWRHWSPLFSSVNCAISSIPMHVTDKIKAWLIHFVLCSTLPIAYTHRDIPVQSTGSNLVKYLARTFAAFIWIIKYFPSVFLVGHPRFYYV